MKNYGILIKKKCVFIKTNFVRLERWFLGQKVFLKISHKFIGKHLCRRLFYNKVAGLKPATLLKMRLCVFTEHLQAIASIKFRSSRS